MGLNKFSIKLFMFLCLITLAGFGFVWSMYSSQLIITNVVLLGIFISLFFYVLSYINKTNKDLNQFIKSIHYLDNVPSSINSDLSHGKLQITYNSIIDQLKDSWLAKESEQQHLKFVLEHIGVGIISFDLNGNVELFNKSAQELFGLKHLDNIYQLNSIKENFADDLLSLKTEKTKIFSFNGKLEQYKILVRSTEIKIENRKLKLVSFQNIKTQLEESEIDAWQKLIRVLTHEIMNSVTPIKSLTYSMQKSLIENSNQNTESILKGLNAIENRSKGLLGFVESYKNLTQIHKPNYERVEVKLMFEHIQSLFEKELNENKVNLTLKVSSDCSLITDRELLSQILINLIKNSIYALENSTVKNINLECESKHENICIKVNDNGKGIPEEIIDKIFIPFYTTRENGSGIGLSFARQVMVMLNGNIEVKSVPNKKTEFILNF